MFPEGWGTTKCSSDPVQMITHNELALLHTTDTTVVSLHTQMGQDPSLTPRSKNGNLGSCQFFSHNSVAGNTWPIMLQNALVRTPCIDTDPSYTISILSPLPIQL